MSPPGEQVILSHSAEAIEGSDDILIKILLFLPAKPLFMFKIVSKRWLSLISEPPFSSLWKPKDFPSALILSGRQLPRPCFIPLNDNEESKATYRPLDFIKDDSTNFLEVLSSCSGLILCRKSFHQYIVRNPTIKQFSTLPHPNTYPKDMTLVFDHSISSHYIVISVGQGIYIEIYSSATNSWRYSHAQFPHLFKSYLENSNGIFFNGAIFWMFRKLNSFCYFDINTETFSHSYAMPEIGEEYYYCGSVHGNLHLAGSSVSTLHQLDIFELGNDYSSWSLKHSIHLYNSSGAFRELVYTSRCPRDMYFVESRIAMVSLKAKKGNQEPHFTLYIPQRLLLFSLKGNPHPELSLHSVHHLTENPFWIGSN